MKSYDYNTELTYSTIADSHVTNTNVKTIRSKFLPCFGNHVRMYRAILQIRFFKITRTMCIYVFFYKQGS